MEPDLKVFFDEKKYVPRIVDKENLKPLVNYEADFEDYHEYMSNLPFITDLYWLKNKFCTMKIEEINFNELKKLN